MDYNDFNGNKFSIKEIASNHIKKRKKLNYLKKELEIQGGTAGEINKQEEKRDKYNK